jgi:hypothetical protein
VRDLATLGIRPLSVGSPMLEVAWCLPQALAREPFFVQVIL